MVMRVCSGKYKNKLIKTDLSINRNLVNKIKKNEAGKNGKNELKKNEFTRNKINKNKNLISFVSQPTGASSTSYRPTTNKVRQAVFNILQNKISNANVIDLCCGCGSIGIEALSLGAQFVLFVDNNINAIKLVHSNIDNLNIKENNIEEGITKKTNVKKNRTQSAKYFALSANASNLPDAGSIFINGEYKTNFFDIAYIDPPYEHNRTIENISPILNELHMKKWLNKNCTLVVECSAKFNTELLLSNLKNKNVFKFIEERKYGASKIIILNTLDVI